MHFIYRTLLVAFVVQFSLQNVIKKETQNRIFKGKIAEPHSAPYMVGLYIKDKDGDGLCGGSLIKPKFVLTAAHCLVGSLSVKVIIGIQALEQAKDTDFAKILNIKMHKKFDLTRGKCDIALVELRKPVQLSNKIALIQLPKKSDASSLLGKYGRFTGFGDISDEDEEEHEILKELKVHIVSNGNCRRFKYFDSTHICGYGEDGGSACHGDSGSPLVLENTDIQIGIASFISTKGCTKGIPHIYTNVVSYLDWIKKWTK